MSQHRQVLLGNHPPFGKRTSDAAICLDPMSFLRDATSRMTSIKKNLDSCVCTAIAELNEQSNTYTTVSHLPVHIMLEIFSPFVKGSHEIRVERKSPKPHDSRLHQFLSLRWIGLRQVYVCRKHADALVSDVPLGVGDGAETWKMHRTSGHLLTCRGLPTSSAASHS